MGVGNLYADYQIKGDVFRVFLDFLSVCLVCPSLWFRAFVLGYVFLASYLDFPSFPVFLGPFLAYYRVSLVIVCFLGWARVFLGFVCYFLDLARVFPVLVCCFLDWEYICLVFVCFLGCLRVSLFVPVCLGCICCLVYLVSVLWVWGLRSVFREVGQAGVYCSTVVYTLVEAFQMLSGLVAPEIFYDD